MPILEHDIPAQRTTSLIFVWLLMAISGFVMIEPSPFELLGAVIVVTFFAFGLRIPKNIGMAVVCLGLFIVLSIPAAINSDDVTTAFKPIGIRFYLITLWLFLSCLIYENPKRILPVLLNGYAVGAVIVVIIGAMAYFGVIPNPESFLKNSRVKSTFKDPNVFGPYLVPMFMLYFSRLERGETHWLFNGIMLVIFTVGLLLSFSRGAWLNLGLAMLTYLSIRLLTLSQPQELTRLLRIGFAALIAGAILIGWLINTDAIADLFKERAHVVQGYDVNERFATQMKAVNSILQTPLGIGPGQVEIPFGIVPHNVYLFILTECGWFAGTAFVVFLVITLKRGLEFTLYRSEMQLIGLVIFSCIVSTQLQSFFIDSTHWRHLYILYGMMWGLILHYERS